MTSYALDRLRWPEVERALARDPRLILPVGALEQHGPHLPLGANTLIADAVATRNSDRLQVLRAPGFPYGVTLSGGPWPGRTGLRRKTFHRVLNELMARWEDQGVREFLVISAHRYDPHLEAILMALTANSVTTVFDLNEIDVSDLLEGDAWYEHGGELETSLLLHLDPDLVAMDDVSDFVPEARALRRYTRGRVPTPPAESRGVIGRPSLATAAKGRAVLERYVEALVHAVGSPGPPGP
ncbi:MAG TPA: creatininase family protein [Longimicrobiales bacterium]|nr:creatininase family protein [Longimicrobiales bacterium]